MYASLKQHHVEQIMDFFNRGRRGRAFIRADSSYKLSSSFACITTVQFLAQRPDIYKDKKIRPLVFAFNLLNETKVLLRGFKKWVEVWQNISLHFCK